MSIFVLIKEQYASLLLSRLPYPTLPSSHDSNTSMTRQETLYKAISVLIFSLQNVHRETRFFASTAAKFDLDLFPGGEIPDVQGKSGLLGEYEEVTRSYVDFLHGIAMSGSVEEGLIVLWSMEKVSSPYSYTRGKIELSKHLYLAYDTFRLISKHGDMLNPIGQRLR